jgi:hypothetical protein
MRKRWGALAALIALGTSHAHADPVCQHDQRVTGEAISGVWTMYQRAGEMRANGMAFLLPSAPIDQLKGRDVTLSASAGGATFNYTGLDFPMRWVERGSDLWVEAPEQKEFFDLEMQDHAAAPGSCTEADRPQLHMHTTANSGYNSVDDIRLIVFSETCIIGAQMTTNTQFDGTPMPSGVHGLVLARGKGC